MISKEDKIYLISSRLQVLHGERSCKINGDIDILDSIEDIDSKIQALTNMLEML
jgi:hypothetical protein